MLAFVPDDDARFFEEIPVEIIRRVAIEGTYNVTARTLRLNAASFQEMARAAQEQTEKLTPKVRCVVTMRSDAGAKFTRREHFVPEGLGFDWTAPSAGVGTCDDVNKTFSTYEGEWLRQGKMGIFRPFYVSNGKDGAPAYYAPNANERRVWLTRDQDGRRTLNVGPDVKMELPESAGSADLVIRVPHNEARVEWVSLALHKMALLTFWLCEGALAFDAAFTDARRFLIEPGQTTYRPFIEQMTEGSTPGVELHYFVTWTSIGSGRCALDTVQCAIKAHHMRYMVVLAGRYDPIPDQSWTPWADPRIKRRDHTTIAFRMASLRHRF
jgi:hypothetical protein